MTTQSNNYNNTDAAGRTGQLRKAGVEESKISELSKSRFEQLPADVQTALLAVN